MQKLISDIPFTERKAFSFVEQTDGFYPVGYSFSTSVENRDLCETFNYWTKNREVHKAFGFASSEFYLRAANYENQVSDFGQRLIDELCTIYSYSNRLNTREDSYLQFNHYRNDLRKSGDRYLQQKHENGNLITIIKPNAPGLVIYNENEECLVDLEPHQAIAISGSLLSELTEGDIPPTYHAVISFTLPADRCSLVYNINVLQETVISFKSGAAVPIRQIANLQHQQFGHHPFDS